MHGRPERALALTIVAGITIALLAACSATAPSDAGSPAAAATPSQAEETPPDSDNAQQLDSDAEGWLAGNLVQLTSSDYDPTTGLITLTTNVTNSSGVDGFTGQYLRWIDLVIGAGAPLTPTSVSSTSVPGRLVEIDIQFFAPQEGVDLSAAVLELGGTGAQQWLLPLAPGQPSTGTDPRDIDLTTTADAAGLTFTATAAEIVPWTCDDSDDYGPNKSGRVSFEPVADDKMGLLVVVDIHESVAYTGGNAVTAIRVLQPDGKTVNHNGAVWTVFAQGDAVEDYVLCFTVDAPVTGDYAVSFDTYRGATGAFTVTAG